MGEAKTSMPIADDSDSTARRASAESRRHHMRIRARKRQKADRCNYTTALFRVRRSEVLLFLSRNPGRHFTPVEIADATAVPVSAVRAIIQHLRKRDHELIRGRSDG